MTKEVLRNVKILGERISKRFNNKLPKTGEKTASDTSGSHVSHKQRQSEREKLCFVFNGLIETVRKNWKLLLMEVGKLTS